MKNLTKIEFNKRLIDKISGLLNFPFNEYFKEIFHPKRNLENNEIRINIFKLRQIRYQLLREIYRFHKEAIDEIIKKDTSLDNDYHKYLRSYYDFLVDSTIRVNIKPYRDKIIMKNLNENIERNLIILAISIQCFTFEQIFLSNNPFWKIRSTHFLEMSTYLVNHFPLEEILERKKINLESLEFLGSLYASLIYDSAILKEYLIYNPQRSDLFNIFSVIMEKEFMEKIGFLSKIKEDGSLFVSFSLEKWKMVMNKIRRDIYSEYYGNVIMKIEKNIENEKTEFKKQSETKENEINL